MAWSPSFRECLRDRYLTPKEKAQFKQLLARAWTSASFAYAAIENDDVLNLLQLLCPKVELPSRRTLVSMVPRQADEIEKNMTAVLKGTGFLTLAFEGFSSAE